MKKIIMSNPLGRSQNLPILLLGSQIATGGSQHVLLRQAAWFFQHGYPVTVAFLYDKENLLASWRSIYPFPILDLRFSPRAANPLVRAMRFLIGILRLFFLIVRGRYTAIETFTAHANLIGLPLAWVAGIPNRIGSHRGKIEGFPRVLERMNVLVINSPIATSFVAVSEQVREDAIAEGIRPDRIVQIANGVDISKVDPADIFRVRTELGVSDDGILLLSVGRLMYQKGHTILLKALPAILAEFPKTVTAIAGGGPLESELQAEAERLNISEKVKFLGVRDDIPVLLSAADIFLFPSRFEGMPNSVLEAMGYGLPVIATDVQGVGELISDRENGIIVPVDNPVAISHAVLHLLNHPEERLRLGKAAQKTIKSEYTLDTMCVKYEELLTAKGAGSRE